MTRRTALLTLPSAALLAQQNEPPRNPAERVGRLQPGDPAPDFHLRKSKSEEKVRLSDFQGKQPVALVFGSYT